MGVEGSKYQEQKICSKKTSMQEYKEIKIKTPVHVTERHCAIMYICTTEQPTIAGNSLDPFYHL